MAHGQSLVNTVLSVMAQQQFAPVPVLLCASQALPHCVSRRKAKEGSRLRADINVGEDEAYKGRRSSRASMFGPEDQDDNGMEVRLASALAPTAVSFLQQKYWLLAYVRTKLGGSVKGYISNLLVLLRRAAGAAVLHRC